MSALAEPLAESPPVDKTGLGAGPDVVAWPVPPQKPWCMKLSPRSTAASGAPLRCASQTHQNLPRSGHVRR